METYDPNAGLCPDAMEVLAWQAAATFESTRKRAAAIINADEVIGSCERCLNGGLMRGDPSKPCALADIAIKFTALGPEYE